MLTPRSPAFPWIPLDWVVSTLPGQNSTCTTTSSLGKQVHPQSFPARRRSGAYPCKLWVKSWRSAWEVPLRCRSSRRTAASRVSCRRPWYRPGTVVTPSGGNCLECGSCGPKGSGRCRWFSGRDQFCCGFTQRKPTSELRGNALAAEISADEPANAADRYEVPAMKVETVLPRAVLVS